LIAIICALIFNSFTKPFYSLTFKLLQDPVHLGIVNDLSEWSTAGTYFGQCYVTDTEIACEINLDVPRSSYFHSAGGDEVLNTWLYAYAQNPKQDYLEISESFGSGTNSIISTIWPMRWDVTANGGSGAYVSDYLGADLSWKNGND
jgi:hypothetical protein